MDKRAPYNKHKYQRQQKYNEDNQVGDLLLNVKCVPNGSKHWKFYAKGMVAYVADHQELLTPTQINKKQNKSIDAYGSYLSYMSRDTAKKENDVNPSSHIWHYTNLKQYKGEDISTWKTRANKARFNLVKLDEVRKIHSKSHIWSIVVSEKDLAMKDIMFENQHKIADAIIRQLFPFPVDATLAFHGNTEHPHIHIMVYQPKNMKNEHIIKKWKLKQHNLDLAKKSYFYFLTKNKNYFEKLLNEKAKLRNMFDGELLQRVFQKQFIELLDELAKDKIPLLDENNQPVFSKNGIPLMQLKFQYNRLNESQQTKVKQIKELLLNINTNHAAINEFQEQYKKFNGVGSKLIEEEFEFLPDKKKEALIEKTNLLFAEADEKICQQILKTARDFYFKNKPILVNHNHHFNALPNEYNKKNDNYVKTNDKNSEDKLFVKPAINKVLTALAQTDLNNFYHDVKNNYNINQNFTELKKLISQIKYEKGNI